MRKEDSLWELWKTTKGAHSHVIWVPEGPEIANGVENLFN